MKSIFIVVIIFLMLTFSVSAEIVITEIMYDVSGSDDGYEWIEIYNLGPGSVDMTGWKFFESGVKHGITIKQGSLNLDSGDILIIADNHANFLSDYPWYSGNLADSAFLLSNTGEELSILDDGLNVQDVVFYSDFAAAGNSIELKDPSLDNNDMKNWKEGAEGGIPGTVLFLREGESSRGNDVPEFSSYGVIMILGVLGFFYFKR